MGFQPSILWVVYDIAIPTLEHPRHILEPSLSRRIVRGWTHVRAVSRALAWFLSETGTEVACCACCACCAGSEWEKDKAKWKEERKPRFFMIFSSKRTGKSWAIYSHLVKIESCSHSSLNVFNVSFLHVISTVFPQHDLQWTELYWTRMGLSRALTVGSVKLWISPAARSGTDPS